MATIEQELYIASMNYGACLERLTKAEAFMRDTATHSSMKTTKVTVSWDYGSGCTGYDELSRIVSQYVANTLQDSLHNAVVLLRKQAREAGANLDRLRKQYLGEL